MQANASQNMGKSEYQIPIFFKILIEFFQKMTAFQPMDYPHPITSPIFRKKFSHQTITFYTVEVQLIRVENSLSSYREKQAGRQRNKAITYAPKLFSPGSGNRRYIRQRSSGHFLYCGLGSALWKKLSNMDVTLCDPCFKNGNTFHLYLLWWLPSTFQYLFFVVYSKVYLEDI